MSELDHRRLMDFLKEADSQPLPGAYLIHGQEMLVDKSSEHLLAHLADGVSADLCCVKMEGLTENVGDALEHLNTFSLMGGPKIILFKDSKLFEGRRNQQRWVDQIVEAWNSEDVDLAAKALLSLCGKLEMDLDELGRGAPANTALKSLTAELGSEGIEKLLRLCHSQGWSPATGGSTGHIDSLQQALAKGFPQHHYLIVTVNSKVPKNLKLYKSFKKHGAVIDCSVPTGESRADKAAQEAVLHQTMNELLATSGKRLEPGGFQLLCQLTGFDPRIFAQNIEKLIDYTGEHLEITVSDIRTVLKRTKVDPIFALTNAVAEKNITQSLNFLKALSGAKWHPLQILSALTNQMRKLLIAKSFLSSPFGNRWTKTMSYPQFQKTVMPDIVAYDQDIHQQISQWTEAEANSSKKRGAGKKATVDVVLAANPRSPYPVYQTLRKADRFSLEELLNAMACLNQTDLRLKSTGQDVNLVLKNVLMQICIKN